MKKALIFDLDGCLVNSSARFKRLNLDAYNRRDINAWTKSVQWYNADWRGDEVIELGVDLLDMLCSFYKPDRVFFITARGAGGYAPTFMWLQDEGIWDEDCMLIMHPEDFDNYQFTTQSDHAAFKKNTAMEIMNDYEIVYAVDDSEDNVQAYRDLKIPTLKFCVPVGRMLV
jgi:hypothetical protein